MQQLRLASNWTIDGRFPELSALYTHLEKSSVNFHDLGSRYRDFVSKPHLTTLS